MKKGLGFKILIAILILLLAGAVFQLMETFSLHTMNVHTQIKATPPGIARIIENTEEPSGGAPIIDGSENPPSFTPTSGGSGNSPVSTQTAGGNQDPPDPTATTPTTDGEEEPPSTTTPPEGKEQPPAAAPPAGGGGGGGAPSGMKLNVDQEPTILTINTDIDFGTVFPGEVRQGHFIVYLTGTDGEPWPEEFTQVTYNVTLLAPPDAAYKDMRPYLLVQRNPAESDTEPVSTANGTAGDYFAFGHLDADAGDTGDEWLVTLYTPDEAGDYWIEIEIGAPYEGPLP
jgi:hypothetical protein